MSNGAGPDHVQVDILHAIPQIRIPLNPCRVVSVAPVRSSSVFPNIIQRREITGQRLHQVRYRHFRLRPEQEMNVIHGQAISPQGRGTSAAVEACPQHAAV